MQQTRDGFSALMIAAQSNPESTKAILDAVDLGATSYLVKPFKESDLIDRVLSALKI